MLGLVETRLLDVVPRVYRKLDDALGRVYPGAGVGVPAFLRFGSWIGGDRDGHPNVTHDVTAAAVRLQQDTILRHYVTRVEDLWRRLSHSDRMRDARPGVPRVAGRRRRPAGRPVPAGPPARPSPHEPYRAKCRFIVEKLHRTREFVAAGAADWARGPAAPPAGRLPRPGGPARRPPGDRSRPAAGRGRRPRPTASSGT